MKIWIINHYATEASSDGMWGRHYNIAKELTKKGYEVTIITAGFLHNKFYETRYYKNGLFDTDLVHGVRYIWIKTFPYNKNNWRRFVNICSFALKAVLVGLKQEPPDIIIASSFHPLTWISGYLLAKKHNSQFVSEVRDLWPETAISLGVIGRNSIIALVLRKVEKFIYLKSSKVITVLPYAHKYLTSLGIDEMKISYIPNGADPALYDIQGKLNHEFNDYLNYHPILADDSKFKVIYTGAHGLVNSLDTAIAAADILHHEGYKDIVFLFIGDGPEKANLKQLVNKLRLNNVYFCEPVAKTVLPYILNKADVCLLLGKDISLYQYGISPNKLFDYLASAKPIILSGNFPNNIVQLAECGFVIPPEDPDKLSDAILELFNTPQIRRIQLGENGYRYFLANHTYQALADKLEKEVIQEVCNTNIK